MPTVLELLGVKAPARVTGQSLVPAIQSGRSGRDTVITGWGEHGAVRTPEWCYIGRWSEGTPFTELYDVRRDPEELHSVASQQPDIVKQMRAELKQHVDSGWALTRGTFAITLRDPQG
jgi:arylsulfatase A-like enzyme